MLEGFSTPEEAYSDKLGAALKMERAVLEILEVNVRNAEDARVKRLLASHLEESRATGQILESVFGTLGWEVAEAPCPVADAFEKEDKAKIKRAGPGIVDTVVLQGVVEVEHYGIGVYENLLSRARAMRRLDIDEPLQRNARAKRVVLEQSKAMLVELSRPTTLPRRAPRSSVAG